MWAQGVKWPDAGIVPYQAALDDPASPPPTLPEPGANRHGQTDTVRPSQTCFTIPPVSQHPIRQVARTYGFRHAGRRAPPDGRSRPYTHVGLPDDGVTFKGSG
jgi:hypothetical protein